MITSDKDVTLKHTKSHLCECHLTESSTHDVWLDQIFPAQLAHPTTVASELKSDDQGELDFYFTPKAAMSSLQKRKKPHTAINMSPSWVGGSWR